MSARNPVSIGAILGASGSGKSSTIKLELLAVDPARRAIWDPKREYARFGNVCTRLEAFAGAVLRSTAFRVVFQPHGSRKAMRAQFDVFCKVVKQAGNAWCVVDELADVTEPNWAPEGWEVLTRQGRHAGVTIRGASQRPADIDKSFYGNASHLAVFRLNAEGDVARCAKLLDVPPDRVRALLPLQFITRDMLTGELDEKKITPAQLSTIPT